MKQASRPAPPGITSPSTGGDAGMNLLFLVAMALVFNSHLEEYHVRPWLAGDGLLGNSMFFVLSGYRISLSLANRPASFVPYLKRRLLRIYPAVWLVVLTLGPTAGWLAPATTPAGAFHLLVWPTRFTYVMGIVPAYILLYLIERMNPRLPVRMFLLTATLAMVFLAANQNSTAPPSLSAVSPWVYAALFFAAVLAGTVLANTKAWRRSSTWLPLLALLISAVYLVLKLNAALAHDWSGFLLILPLGALSAVTLVAAGLPGTVWPWLAAVPGLPRSAAFVARYSLEIYTVHCIVIEWTWLRRMGFPLGLVGVVVISLALAAAAGMILHRLLGPRDLAPRP